MWEWLWQGENLGWVILGIFGIRFLIKDVPKLAYIWKNTDKYSNEDENPSGNDNIKPHKPYDYM